MSSVTTDSLDDLLRAVSRSIYLTLRVLPRVIRPQVGLAYLFCRAADTIADTRLLPADERLAHLATLRGQFEQSDPDLGAVGRLAARVGEPLAIAEERELLRQLGACFALYATFSPEDRACLARLVATLSRGMELDLRYFPSEESGEVRALADDEALDHYCYYVAGCVGEFWTDVHLAHFPILRRRWDAERARQKAIRFGKGLQMTNILRDVDRDLGIGRCYLPATRLEALAIRPQDLRRSRDRSALRPLMRDLLRQTLEHYRVGWDYTLAIPRRLVRTRLACAWPLLIGLRTLEELAVRDDPCRAGEVTKISRPEVYRLVRASAWRAGSNRLLDRLYGRLERRVREYAP